MKLRTFDEFMAADMKDDLRDPDFALGYLQACLDEAKANNDTHIFFSAVRYVARANEPYEERESDDAPRPRFAIKSNRPSDVEDRELVPA